MSIEKFSEEEFKAAQAIMVYCKLCSAKIGVSAKNCPMVKCHLFKYRYINSEGNGPLRKFIRRLCK